MRGEVREAIFESLIEGPGRKEQPWKEKLDHWSEVIREKECAEEALRARMVPEVARILRSEKRCAVKALLAELGCVDPALVAVLAAGVPRYGDLGRTGLFPPKRVDATHTVADVMKGAKAAQRISRGLKARIIEVQKKGGGREEPGGSERGSGLAPGTLQRERD